MAKKKYEETNIQAIADAIREKTGTESTYDTSEMASGVNEVYEAGKKASTKAFWDKYLKPNTNGGFFNSATYLFAGTCWNDDTFYPDRDIVAVGYNTAFFQYNACTNLRQRFQELGITIGGMNNSSTLNSVQNFFYGAKTTELPDMVYFKPSNLQSFCGNCINLKWFPHYDTSKVTTMYGTFSGCSSLERIEGIDFSSVTVFSSTFTGCTALTTITVYGEIIRSVSFSDCPLTVASLKSIITHLKNYSGTSSEYAYTVIFSSACIEALEAEGNTSPNGNSWLDYIDDLGWTRG